MTASTNAATTAKTPRPNLAVHERRLNDHEQRLDDIEARMDKYDVIIGRLDVLIDVLTKQVENTAKKADNALDGQGVLKERNEHAHRWATLGISLGSSTLVGMAMYFVGHFAGR